MSLQIETTEEYSVRQRRTHIQVGEIGGAADFRASKTRATVGDGITFTDISTVDESAVTARQWDFGDNSFSNVLNPTHAYTAPGIYTVSLTLSTASKTFVETKENYIVVGNPLDADFTYDNAFVGEDTVFFPFIFGASGTVSYAWNFGDGEVSTDAQPRHRFPGRGEFVVVLEVTDGSGFATVQKKITINFRPPQVLFIAQPTTQSKGKEIECFVRTIGGSGTVIDWVWDFGDGSGSTEQHPNTRMRGRDLIRFLAPPLGRPEGKPVKKDTSRSLTALSRAKAILPWTIMSTRMMGASTIQRPVKGLCGRAVEIATAYLVDKMTSQCWNPDDTV